MARYPKSDDSRETSAAFTGDKDEEPEGEVECAICFEVNNPHQCAIDGKERNRK